MKVYTQGLQRREFEVGYTHRRERALKEGEDASIELARQMEAQVCHGDGDGDGLASVARAILGFSTRKYPTGISSWSSLSRKHSVSLCWTHSILSEPCERFSPPAFRFGPYRRRTFPQAPR